MNRTVRCQAAIVCDDQVLLIQHRYHADGYGWWLLPGGGLEAGESEEQCMQREAYEETGLEVRVERLLLDEVDFPAGAYQRIHTFLCSVLGGELHPGYEPEPDAAAAYAIADVRWVDLRSESAWGSAVWGDPFTYPTLRRVQQALGYAVAPIPRQVISEDGELVLRPPSASDVPLLWQAVNESVAQIKPWMNWAHDGYTEAEALTWIEALGQTWEAGSQYQFLIMDRERRQVLGACGLNHINRFYRLANLGYWVRSSQTGQGVASRAARALARFGFEHLGLQRAEIVVAVGNQPSLRAAQKAGAQREGVLRRRLHEGDAVMHSLTPDDFQLSE